MAARKVGITAEFPRSGVVVIGTAEAAIRVIVVDVERDGTVYFEIHSERGRFPGVSTRGREQCINGTVSPSPSEAAVSQNPSTPARRGAWEEVMRHD